MSILKGDSFLDDIEEERFELGSEITELAGEQATKAVNAFEKIRKKLLDKNSDGYGGMSPPAYEEVLTDDIYWEEISYIYSIINNYRSCDFDSMAHEINKDLIERQGGIIRLATLVGFAKGTATMAESDRKLVSAKLHIQIREIAEELNLKMTDSAAEKMSRAESQGHQEMAAYSLTAFEMLQALYFSSMAFVRVLEGVAQRLHHERFSKHTEG